MADSHEAIIQECLAAAVQGSEASDSAVLLCIAMGDGGRLP